MGKCPWPLKILSEKIARSCSSTDRSIRCPQQNSALRQRMIDDMTIRNMSPLTQKAYVRAVKNFSKHFGKSPDQLTFEHVREYHAISRAMVCALEMASSSFTAIETGGIDKPVAVLHIEKIPRHIQDRLLFITKGAAPALCCGAGVGPRRPRNPEVVMAQSPKLRSSNSSDAPGIGQQRERDGMRSQRPQDAFRRR
jgi:Phage integrase, N-terminal SAM-like domain